MKYLIVVYYIIWICDIEESLSLTGPKDSETPVKNTVVIKPNIQHNHKLSENNWLIW